MSVADITSHRPLQAGMSKSQVNWAILFVITLFIPLQYRLGSLLLTPQRIMLLVLFFPALFMWLSGRAGRFLAADFLILAYLVWGALSFLSNHGTRLIQLIGITTVETFGAYLVARCFIRTTDDLRRVAKTLFILMLFMIPAAALESLTKARIYNDLFGMLGHTFPWVNYEPRMGMYRAQAVFEHPILYGVFTSMAFSLIYLTPRPGKQKVYGWWRAWAVGAAGFFSLSSGAYLSIMTQIGLMVWDRLTRAVRNRWKIFIALVIAGYVTIDLLSNRTPFQVFASYMTFNSGTAYWRILIFRYGMENVWAHPIFGIGLSNWSRPSWMHTSSVDNFWLLTAMRNGIPAFLLIAAAFTVTVLKLSFMQIRDFALDKARYAMIFGILGLSMALASVHVWGATYMFMMFILGLSSAVLTMPEPAGGDDTGQEDPEPLAKPDPRARYTRFARTTARPRTAAARDRQPGPETAVSGQSTQFRRRKG